MIELRKDYVLDRWSYIALGRSKRPQETKTENADVTTDSTCYFCPGNENLTPPEIGRIADGEKWKVRWFANKFPAVEPELEKNIEYEKDFFIKNEGFGFHEVIAETPDHSKQLAQLSKEELCNVFTAYVSRIDELSSREGVKYVQIFKNNGVEGGCSIAHSHSQIIAGNIVPRYVQEKIAAVKKYNTCPYCEIIKKEEKSERFICDNEDFIAFTSFAPRFNFEAMIFPKKHYRNITELSETEIESLSEVFQKVLSKLGKLKIPYNFYLHYSPEGEDLHFHFEITPRFNTWAGFELATESFVITTSPEEAASFYRE
ncbi:MAG: galactose-1-phosphate uridylyltransferase [Candidatus Paceibacterota bacterium]